jgi:uncharacterized membrane protein
MTFTPIGFINLVVINATIVHVPVIIGSLLLGPGTGAGLGAMFGLASFIRNSTAPNNLLAFAFSPLVAVPGAAKGSLWALVICFVPRILVGIVPWYADRFFTSAFQGNKKTRVASLFAAGIAGSMTNTILVMHLIFFIFQDAFAQARDVPVETVYRLVSSIIVTNGIPEALAAGVLASAACKAVEAYGRR